ncbi:MAG: TetR/AcrR family transcriptional regulator [Candidatus Geothermincolia bacterium]
MGEPLKEKILNSARELFLARGYRTTTMDDIARRAGMSKRTLYEKFPSKSTIASEVVENELKVFSSRMRAIIKSAGNPLEKLRNLSRFFMELPYPRITPIALIDLQRDLPDLWARVQKVEEEIVSEIRQVIDEGKEQGIFRSGIDTNVTIAALTGALSSTMSPGFLLNTSLSLEEVYATIFELVTNGICENNGAARDASAAAGRGSSGKKD